MGLDMYLDRIEVIEGTTIEDAFSALKILQDIDIVNVDTKEALSKELLDKYYKNYTLKYPDWDKDKEFGNYSLQEEAMYWRKANAIHKWFVDNIQNGIDECEAHYVTFDELMNLKDICQEVVDKAIIEEGEVVSHYSYSKGSKITHYVDEKIIKNDDEMDKILPTESGFFFGETTYDEYYFEYVKETLEFLKEIEKDKDNNKYVYFYTSSW